MGVESCTKASISILVTTAGVTNSEAFASSPPFIASSTFGGAKELTLIPSLIFRLYSCNSVFSALFFDFFESDAKYLSLNKGKPQFVSTTSQTLESTTTTECNLSMVSLDLAKAFCGGTSRQCNT
ncbi:hypothetical protein O6H91_12G094100 [Diphasiastrum complanatum]|uniref:Uncharacterized protein n=1 Tax=Diphasiastrum complanatum TaxID=34168 RepID=A0ACC2C5A1_DIPCM|nr:hypothetical protein O6H91_12G094100 [Diphasiastrum complanatum]